jgi:hypothetical protein
MIYVFIFRSDIEQEKDLHSMQIDVQLSGKIVGARPPSAAYCSTTNTELSILARPILLQKSVDFKRGKQVFSWAVSFGKAS